MSGQGYYFAIEPEQVNNLISCADAAKRWEIIDELSLEWDNDPDRAGGGFKEWPILQRVLCDGSFEPKAGRYPLNLPFIGGHLVEQQCGIINVLTPSEVRDLSPALHEHDWEWFIRAFERLFAAEYANARERLEHDTAANWICFDDLRKFYSRAAKSNLGAVFWTDETLHPDDIRH